MIKEVYNSILRWSIKRQSARCTVILTGNAGGREGNRLRYADRNTCYHGSALMWPT